MHKEMPARSSSGFTMLALLLLSQIASVAALVVLPGALKVPALLWVLASAICWFGFYMVQPNQSAVLQLFGRYVGTDFTNGLRWANPFFSKQKVSLRVRNFESSKLKVNDHAGNPVDIAAVVVWKVVDSAEAVFEVEDYENFVTIQSEAAIRYLASSYPYEAEQSSDISLRSSGDEITDLLRTEIQNRLQKAGVTVIEARISHLAYAQEIASAMLQRQQARAVVMARQQIVEGAVGMVEMALNRLAEKDVVSLDEERKAAMVSNLLVVLCGDHSVTPVVNTGTLY
ncbi:SPFH domain-containing protein [Rheinheimera sp. 4Y26]|uniref:SPFH domain-containing protein n=1 Tax=Rheinheimera sp. 4Y26 TaxID=2977811 RepID=UPI0021B0FBBD|nr:SPFH domain-containing protein [Rheinheimera sp. 4Y26]MCT6698591.1 SPFH domain-containing protein [Rheinheimera sp. 4Y26]